MSILAKVKELGLQLKVVDGKPYIEYPETTPPEIIEQIRAHRKEIARALEEQKIIHGYSKAKSDPLPVCENFRWCEGYKPARRVSVEVCEWHISMADIHCIECKHLSTQDIKTWCNAYMDKAVKHLNQLYQGKGKISYTRRKETNHLERAITEAFLTYDIERFKGLVDKWFDCFKEMCVPMDEYNTVKDRDEWESIY